mmetsp:Transcript_52665/g.123648  ORF Transcript_52665/g.123648 Transcript_52665/m.123648 type:complete len:252 (-) Transcript_52665:58-813(-)
MVVLSLAGNARAHRLTTLVFEVLVRHDGGHFHLVRHVNAAFFSAFIHIKPASLLAAEVPRIRHRLWCVMSICYISEALGTVASEGRAGRSAALLVRAPGLVQLGGVRRPAAKAGVLRALRYTALLCRCTELVFLFVRYCVGGITLHCRAESVATLSVIGCHVIEVIRIGLVAGTTIPSPAGGAATVLIVASLELLEVWLWGPSILQIAWMCATAFFISSEATTFWCLLIMAQLPCLWSEQQQRCNAEDLLH